MAIFHRYLFIVFACIAMLAGIQVPNLADQYRKRIDAHLREVTANIKPFQDVANMYTGGSLDQLIEMHRRSTEPAFRDEGIALENMVKRKLRFEADLALLQTSLPMQVVNILLKGDREIMDETLAQYTYAVPLNEDALIAGAAAVALLLLLAELLWALVRYIASTVMARRAGQAS